MPTGRGKKRRLHGPRAALLVVALGVGFLASLAWRIHAAGRVDERGAADVIIVLGAAQYDGRPSPVFQARIDHALTLYREGCAPRLLFTGGNRPGDRHTEAMAGRDYAISRGVPAAAILTEDRGRTTRESLERSAALMREGGMRTAILVSDPFHAFRLRRMARDLGLAARVSPAAHSRVRSARMQARYILREVGVYLLYRVFGL